MSGDTTNEAVQARRGEMYDTYVQRLVYHHTRSAGRRLKTLKLLLRLLPARGGTSLQAALASGPVDAISSTNSLGQQLPDSTGRRTNTAACVACCSVSVCPRTYGVVRGTRNQECEPFRPHNINMNLYAAVHEVATVSPTLNSKATHLTTNGSTSFFDSDRRTA